MRLNLSVLEGRLRSRLGSSADIRFRPLVVAGQPGLLLFLEPVIDQIQLDQDLVRPMQELVQVSRPEDLLQAVQVADAAVLQPDVRSIEQAVLNGDAVLLVDNIGALRASVFKPEHRNVEEPAVENTTRGPRDSFVEILRTNLNALRIRLRDPKLRIETVRIGRRAQTTCALVYLSDVADPAILKVARDRLHAIDVDGISGDGALQEYLSDHYWSPFPQLRPTERPDWAAWEIMQGKIAILLDGTPTVLLGPATIADFYRSPEDYKHGIWEAVYVRAFLRFVAFFVALYLPGLYVALTDVTPDLLPTTLAISIAGSREGVPFPALVEVLFMEVGLELLREATLRMPRLLAATVGIVGGLVLGQSAVEAKVVSDIMIIVISLTAMAQFVPPSPEISITWRLIRWGFTLSAAFLGVFGLALVSFLLLFHMAGLQSLGVPYLAPLSPTHRSLWTDSMTRAPLQWFARRPKRNHPQDEVRAKPYDRPQQHPDLEQLRSEPGQTGGDSDST